MRSGSSSHPIVQLGFLISSKQQRINCVLRVLAETFFSTMLLLEAIKNITSWSLMGCPVFLAVDGAVSSRSSSPFIMKPSSGNMEPSWTGKSCYCRGSAPCLFPLGGLVGSALVFGLLVDKCDRLRGRGYSHSKFTSVNHDVLVIMHVVGSCVTSKIRRPEVRPVLCHRYHNLKGSP